jgi:hypothetical protein
MIKQKRCCDCINYYYLIDTHALVFPMCKIYKGNRIPANACHSYKRKWYLFWRNK